MTETEALLRAIVAAVNRADGGASGVATSLAGELSGALERLGLPWRVGWRDGRGRLVAVTGAESTRRE